ncbi:MAG: GNAT family N-acetyltransferase [Deltaproteobacteria bacterium]|nr:GNAT family N-acetyltransferase [Deltaproteobacteria bacterium]
MARCELCRLRYDPNSPADRLRHRRMHEALLNGLPYRPARSDRVVFEEDGARVAVVTPESPFAQRRRAVTAFRLASREMRYSGAGYSKREPKEDESHAFLLYRGGRLIGVFILARWTRWVEGAWNQEDPNGVADVSGWEVLRRQAKGEPVWSVDFMWVARNYRRQGWGKLLLDAAARLLGTPVDEFAWGPPFTPVGKAFIRRVRPGSFRAPL